MRCALASLVAVATLIAGAAAAVARPPAGQPLRVDVAEWSLVPSTGAVRAGLVRIRIRNLGTVAHRLAIVRTRHFADRLPVDGPRVSVRPLARSISVLPGRVASFALRLKPGSYLLYDDLPWHYWLGTSVAFSVD